MAKNQPIKYKSKNKSIEVKETAKVDQLPPAIKFCKSKRSQAKKNTPETIAVKAVKEIKGPLFKENETPPIEAKIMNIYKIGLKIVSIQATGSSRTILPQAISTKKDIKWPNPLKHNNIEPITRISRPKRIEKEMFLSKKAS